MLIDGSVSGRSTRDLRSTSCVLLLLCLALASCAAPRWHGRVDVHDDLERRVGHGLAPVSGSADLPPGVEMADGLDTDEAVAVALWSSPDLALTMADVGLARADLLGAARLPNPLLSLLLPWGGKRAEGVVSWPLEVLWTRPRRIREALHHAEAVADGVVATALDLVTAVRVAHADAVAAHQVAALSAESVALRREIAAIEETRLLAGDISENDLSIERVDLTRAAIDARRRRRDEALTREQLRALIGRVELTVPLVGEPLPAQLAGCPQDSSYVRRALAARPELTSAAAAVAAAVAQAGLERADVVRLTATLDGNDKGSSWELGPGLAFAVPVFDRNDGRRARAVAELERAQLQLVARQRAIESEVRARCLELDEAAESFVAERDDVVAVLKQQLERVETALAAGDASRLQVLVAQGRLNDGQRTLAEAWAALWRARARLDRSLGEMSSPGLEGKNAEE